MKQIEFVHQRYWLRVFSFVPMLFLLAYIEYKLFLLFGGEINSIFFCAVSVLIMYAFVFLVFPKLSLLLVRHSFVKFTDESISFFIGGKEFTFDVEEIKTIEFNKIKIYRAKIGQMIVFFKDASKKKLVLYSEDLEDDAIQSSSLYSVYQLIKDLIHE